MKNITMSRNQVEARAIGASAMSRENNYQRISFELYSFLYHDDTAVCQSMGYQSELLTSSTYTILHTSTVLRINVFITPSMIQCITYDFISGMKTSNVDCMKSEFKSLIENIDRILDVEC